MMVSSILPMRGRQQMAAECLAMWQAQDWPEKELIVVDDIDDPSFPGGLSVPRVTYLTMERESVGYKLNVGCDWAEGDMICRFDSDDRYAPGRITDQVRRLQVTGKAVTNYTPLLFTDGTLWWRNENTPGGYGASLCFRRDWWQAHPFPNVNEGEDWHFVMEATRANQFVAADGKDYMVAVTHAGNSTKRVVGHGWIPIDR